MTASRLLYIALLAGGCTADPTPGGTTPLAPSSAASSAAPAGSGSATVETGSGEGDVLFAPVLATAKTSRGIPRTSRDGRGHPQFVWRSEPLDHHCVLEATGTRARCVAIDTPVTRHGSVHGPVPIFRPERPLLYVTKNVGDKTVVALVDLAGMQVVPASLGDAFLDGSGAVYGLEGDHRFHHYEKVGTAPGVTSELPEGRTTMLVGDDLLSLGPGSPRALSAQRVQPRGALGEPESLGAVPRMVNPRACLRQNEGAAVLFLPSYGDSPPVVHGYLREGGRWLAQTTTAFEGTFGDGTVVSCGRGWAAATEATSAFVHSVRCTKSGCDAAKHTLTSPLADASAATIDQTLVLADRPSQGPQAAIARVRSGAADSIEKALPWRVACQDAKPGASGTVDIIASAKGAYVILGSEADAKLCAFLVDVNGNVSPVEPAER